MEHLTFFAKLLFSVLFFVQRSGFFSLFKGMELLSLLSFVYDLFCSISLLDKSSF